MRAEMQAGLVRGLGAVRSRRVGVVTGVWGEPGIGKTFLTDGVLRALACASHRAHATQHFGVLALALPRAAHLPAWVASQLERLTRGEALDAGAALKTLVATLAALAPVVLHLEDLHEATGEGSAQVVALAEAVKRRPGVGLLVTSRSPLPVPIRGQQLSALDGAEMEALLTSELGAALPPEAVDWISGRTRGNPLFALEFLRYLTRGGSLWSDGRQWHWRRPPEDFVPVTVEALIGQLGSGLATSRAQRTVLEARAMLPADLPPARLGGLWAAVAGVTAAELAAATGLFTRAGLFHEDDFAHPLYREVLARHQRVERRRTLARRALWALEDDPLLAARFVEDAGLPPPEALAAYERAAGASRAAQRPLEAARLLAASVSHAPQGEQPTRALAAARALADLGQLEALGLAEQAAQILPEGALLCAELLSSRGRSAEAEAWLRRLPAALAQEQGWQLALRLNTDRGLYHEVLRLWQAHPEYHAGVPVSVLKWVGSAYAFTDDLDTAEGLARSLLARADLTSDELQLARNLMGQVLSMRDDRNRLLAFGEESIALARAADDPTHLALALTNHALCLGDGAGGETIYTLLSEAAQIFGQVGQLLRYAICQLRIGTQKLLDGHFEEAETRLIEAHDLIVGHDAQQFLTESHLKQTRLYLDWQPPHGPPLALRHARRGLELTHDTGDQRLRHVALCYAARAEAQGGHPGRALELAHEAMRLAEQQAHAERLSNAHFALGLALEANGQPEAARGHILASCTAELELGERWFAEHRGLEADRLAGDAVSARVRRDWLLANGHAGAAHLAAHYFPELAVGGAPPAAAPEVRPIRLNVLGPLTTLQGGQPVAYRGRKRAELLACLLEARLAGRAEVSLLDLLDALYPGEPEAAARRTLKQQVYLLREALGASCVLSTGGGYALGTVSSDAEDFLAGGPGTLWRGAYLEGLGEGWRPEVRDALSLALRERIAGVRAAGSPEAARLARILCQLEPYDQAALRLALQVVGAAEGPRAAGSLYGERRAALLEVGEALPEGMEVFLGTRPEQVTAS